MKREKTLHSETELIQSISRKLPAETQRQYYSLIRKLHAGALTPKQQVLTGLVDEFEMHHAHRLGLILELSRLRGVSLEAQMRELRFPRHLYEDRTETRE